LLRSTGIGIVGIIGIIGIGDLGVREDPRPSIVAVSAASRSDHTGVRPSPPRAISDSTLESRSIPGNRG